MHVGAYNKGRGHDLAPPFYCPWANEGCTWPPCYDKAEHQRHIWREHEKPGMEERNIHITLAGHEEDER